MFESLTFSIFDVSFKNFVSISQLIEIRKFFWVFSISDHRRQLMSVLTSFEVLDFTTSWKTFIDDFNRFLFLTFFFHWISRTKSKLFCRTEKISFVSIDNRIEYRSSNIWEVIDQWFSIRYSKSDLVVLSYKSNEEYFSQYDCHIIVIWCKSSILKWHHDCDDDFCRRISFDNRKFVRRQQFCSTIDYQNCWERRLFRFDLCEFHKYRSIYRQRKTSKFLSWRLYLYRSFERFEKNYLEFSNQETDCHLFQRKSFALI